MMFFFIIIVELLLYVSVSSVKRTNFLEQFRLIKYGTYRLGQIGVPKGCDHIGNS
jgi:hypothetical protein